MPKASRIHHSDEFGKQPMSAIKGLDAPLIGAPSTILLDGIVEQESGVTPPPPPISVRAVVIGLVLMLALGLALLVIVSNLQQRDYLTPVNGVVGGTVPPEQLSIRRE